jgi:hypothetical protein
MSPLPTFSFKLLTLNLRRELRIALLAAMETCWVFAVVVFFAEIIGTARPLTPAPFFLAYWLAMLIGRRLPQSRTRWIILQSIAVLIALVTLLAVARAELYPQLDWFDLTWLPRLVPVILSFAHGIAIDHIVVIATLYVFLRGLGLAQRPLTLWFVGLQFRIGIVIFFVLLVIAGFARLLNATSPQQYDPAPWIFIYFFISLIAIALARIEEMASDIHYTPRWAITLLGSVALVLFLGLGLLQLLTVDVVRTMMLIFVPIAWLFGGIIVLLAIPLGYVLNWLVELFKPVFNAINQLIDAMQPVLNTETIRPRVEAFTSFSRTTLIQPIISAAIVLIVLELIRRALNRRMERSEADEYIRESLGDEQGFAAAQRKSTPRKKPAQSRAHQITAESIRRIYAALVAHAAQAGIVRRLAETPYEFEPRLQQQWLEYADDIRTITEAYVAVHYAEQTATVERVNEVRDAWERIKKNLRMRTSPKL